MSTDYVFVDKQIKARKPHNCAWCDELIAIGETCHYTEQMFDGEWQLSWQHLECQDAMLEALQDEPENKIYYSPGDFKRGSVELA